MSASQTYERPALRKALAAFAADSKVANASLAVIAIVVSTSDKLPPPDAASTAEAAAFASGNSPMASQSYHAVSLPPTLWKSLATASSRFSGLASMPLMASDVNRPRETLARAHEGSRHRKTRASRYAFYQEPSWLLLTRLSACQPDCGRGTTGRSSTKQRSFGKSIKTRSLPITMRWNFLMAKSCS